MSYHRTVIFPDVHAPNHHEPSFNAALQFTKWYKPHRFIQLGDFCDWDSVTDYSPKREADISNIKTEIESANELLDRIDSVLPKNCERYMVGGNHEARVERFKVSHGWRPEIRRLKELTSWHQEYNLDKRGWKWCEYRKWFTFWKVVYFHGNWTGQGAAKKHLDYFKRNVIFGHCHQRLIATTTDRDGEPMESESIGTLSKFDLNYLDLPSHDWVHMFCYVDTDTTSFNFSKHSVHVIKGKFIEFNRRFG